MTKKSSLLLIVGCLAIHHQLTAGVFSKETHKHVVSVIEQYLDFKNVASEGPMTLSAQNADGSWPDVEYNDHDDRNRGAWRSMLHLTRYRILCCAYHLTKKQEYLDGAQKALRYWYETMPYSPNWWYNEIGAPRSLGPATILIMKSLSQKDLQGAAKVLSAAKIQKTGQNKIWLSEGVMMRAYIEGDETLLRTARDSIVSEITICNGRGGLHPDWDYYNSFQHDCQYGLCYEGIQPDWSYHLHGAQLQWGNYGLAYAQVMSWIVLLFDGTPFALLPEQRHIIENYLVKGVSQNIWKGMFDMNASGREIYRGSQRNKAQVILQALQRLGLQKDETTGPRYYPYSDFAIYRGNNWYASLRMQSSRTLGMENTNAENMRGRYAADGALLVRQDGDEYEDVAAAWNWHHVPGVTCPDDGKPIYGWDFPKSGRHNLTDKVFGDISGEYMGCAMELNREGLKARKAWFFYPDGIVCLGSGISFHAEKPNTSMPEIVTGVEQCHIKGNVTNKKQLIEHRGISYVSLDGDFQTAPYPHTGEWEAIHPGNFKGTSTIDLLDISISHGTSPHNAHYAYVIAPRHYGNEVRIISNTTAIQSVAIAGQTITIDWDKCSVTFSAQ
ncbi:MAG: polysaccharide lyase family 8 super-sandwich domain-containing protein [Bacteroidales bacterium]|nr:polysaccharide lyase family 8 super-sandwich domain-containing protein [Bacteroidales bacterium]